MADGMRLAPPPLEVQYPLCPMCGEHVDHDGNGFVCERCNAYWSSRNDDVGRDRGAWDDNDAARCPAIDGRWFPGGQWASDGVDLSVYPCLLTDGHAADEHRYADFGGNRRCWGDEHSATPAQLAHVHAAVTGA